MSNDPRKPNQARPVLAVPPHSAAAEQGVLGSLMISHGKWGEAWAKLENLEPDDFYRLDHRLIFGAMAVLAADGRPLDPVTVSVELDRRGHAGDSGGLTYLASLAKETSSTATIEHHSGIVRKKSLLRQLMARGADIHALASDESMDPAELLAILTRQLETVAKRIASKRGKYNLLSADDLAAIPLMRWKVKGLLPAEGTAAIYGPAGSGKSFLALDLAGAIGSGREWFGRRVARSPVVYVCLEGEGGLRNRVAAYRTAHGGDALDGVRFVLQPMSLLGGDPAALVKAIKGAGLENPVVIIDTLNRATPGADENSGKEMSVVNEATKAIQQELGGLVILVHHAGKDASKGMRGSTTLPAALDAVIAVRRDGESRKWSTSQAAGGKVKDGADDIEHEFTLQVHRLGEDEDGDPVTSCTVVPDRTGGTGIGTGTGTGTLEPLGKNGAKAVEILVDLYDQHRANLAESGKPPDDAKVRLTDWCDALRDVGKMPRNRAYDARIEAKKKGYVRLENGYALPLHLAEPNHDFPQLIDFTGTARTERYAPENPPVRQSGTDSSHKGQVFDFTGTERTETVPNGTGTDAQICVPSCTAPPLGGGTVPVRGTGVDEVGQDEGGADGPIPAGSWLAGSDESEVGL